MKQRKTKTMVLYALFIAIEVLLVAIPFLGYIPIGPLRATTLHIPVIIAGIILGSKGGAFVGLIFGLSSLLYNTINPTITSFVFSPFISGSLLSVVIALVPRILIGYTTGFIFAKLQGKMKNEIILMAMSGFIGSMINTILVLGGIYLLFGDRYAIAIGQDLSSLFPYLLGIVTTQGILEAVVGTIVAIPVAKALRTIVRKV